MSDAEWNIKDALGVLQASIDPYIWEQGQDLFKRGAVKDFAMGQDGAIRVIVLDPRDSRNFYVSVRKEYDGRVVSKCACPYRLNGFCRHQVVALEYLKTIARGEEPREADPTPRRVPESSRGDRGDAPVAVVPTAVRVPEGPVLYQLFDVETPVPTREDGSLLRMVLFSVGSLETPHRIGLQLYTGSGWSELRAPELERWISRGECGPHPRDALLGATLVRDGSLRGEIDSETLGFLLPALAGSEALVDRSGRVIEVSRTPWLLCARLSKGEAAGTIDVSLTCRSSRDSDSPEGESCPFDEVVVVPSVAPWIQREDGSFHALDAAAPGPLLAALQEEDLGAMTEDDLDRFLIEGVPRLERLTRGRLAVEPGLIQEVEGVDGARIRLEGDAGRLEGRLELSYGGEWVEAPSSPTPWTSKRDGQIHRYPAAGQSLARARRELEGLGFEFRDGVWGLEGPETLARVLGCAGGFVTLELPDAVRDLDLVHRSPTLELRVRGQDADREGGREADPPLGSGWLDVSFRLKDAGRVLEVEPKALLDAYGRRSGGVLRLADETVLGLDHACVAELVELLTSARRAGGTLEGEGHARVPATAVGTLMQEVEDVDVEFDPGIRSLVNRLRGRKVEGERAVDLRRDVRETLRDYQREAVEWFGQLARWRLAGILADEMGLGKTVMTLAHFFGREAERSDPREPILIVCPTSLVFNWRDECRRFFPHVKVVSLQGAPRAEREERIASSAEIVLTSYALLRRDREALEARAFRAVVLDEAQHIKNAESQTARAAFSLGARERWALTGTPVENHLGELWSVFHFLLPGFLGTSEEFRRNYREPADRGDTDSVDRLRRQVRPFVLRRTKEQVLSDLPPCIEQVQRVPMGDAQRRLYDAQLLAARSDAQAADSPQARFKVLAALTRLRQICCHPRLILDEEAFEELGTDADSGGGKFELLFELIEECIEEEHRVLVFSQFTSMLDLMEERLDELDIARCRLDGSTRDREGEVRRFGRETGIPLFLISLKAGGYGLNLTGADTVILYDPWWNPATEAQAVARAHRMGQALPVHVHKLIAADTVEEKIQALQASKRSLAGRVLDSEEDPLSSLGLEELRGLLE